MGAREGGQQHQARGDRGAVRQREGGAVRALLCVVPRRQPRAAARARAAPLHAAPLRRRARAVRPAVAAPRRALPHRAAAVPRARPRAAPRRRRQAQDGPPLRGELLLARRTIGTLHGPTATLSHGQI